MLRFFKKIMTSAELLKLNDIELIERIQNENESRYFSVLYARYHPKVFDKCYSLIKNRQIAEELSRDILTKVYEKLPGFKHLSSFSSWVYSITYNYCIDYLREKKKLHYPEWNRENEMPEIIDEEETLSEISYEKLLLILERIHPEEKAIILMKYQDNLSLRQIGTALRISEDAVKMRLKRARTRLIVLYSQHFLKD